MKRRAKRRRTVRSGVFVVYSKKDEKWVRELKAALAPLAREQSLKVRSDESIEPGKRWLTEIKRDIARSRVAVLIVSRHFFASEFIAKVERPLIESAAKRRSMRLLWIAVSGFPLRYTALAAIQAANDPRNPLDTMRVPRRNLMWASIACEIMHAAGMKAVGS